MQHIQMQFSPNKEIFSQFFSAFSESTGNLEYFEQKRWASETISFWSYRFQKSGLLKCQNNPMSENLWTVNMLKGLKDCLNLHGGNFVIFFDHSETKIGSKIFVLLVSDILTLFVNILTPNDQYSVSVKAYV